MGHARKTQVRPGLPVAISMLLVVVTFTLSLAYAQLRLLPITQHALDISENAVPSIEHLSAAGTELSRFGLLVTEYTARVGDGAIVSRNDITAARHAVDEELAAYRALPAFPDEAEQLAEIERALGRLDAATGHLLDRMDAGSAPAAARALVEDILPGLGQASMALFRLRTHNVAHTRRSTAAILEAKRGATVMAVALGILSVAIAVIATMLVLRVLRARARLIEAHAQVLAARATELEAFAGRVAHDLKNPLGAVALRILSVVRGSELDPKLRGQLERVGRQVERMDHIIDGLLEFARAGANPPPDSFADVKEILEEVVAEMQAAADRASVELRVEPFPPTAVACTAGALTSVVSNLLGNALKYVVDGKQVPRRVSLRVEPRGDLVRVEVQDNGPGLPPDAENRVFEAFRRFTSTNTPGIGLGLATVKKIVEAYRGRVGVRSVPDEGCTFWFELPEARAEAQGPSDGPLRPQHPTSLA
jgi:signal transduction histidine kinase